MSSRKENTMRVFITGASGAIGTRLVAQLNDRGHEVIGTSRSPKSAERVRALGAEAVELDLLDARAVSKAVLAAQPDAIVHQATALADVRDLKHFDRSFAQTNRLRTDGTDALLAAAREAGVRRFVAQSNVVAYAREAGPVKTEDDPLDSSPLPAMRESLAAMRHLEDAVTAAGGIALRQLLRRHQRRTRRAGAQAAVPDHRRWRRGVLLDPSRRRGGRDRARTRERS
jgi:2-alkyl-3-oxoalkanoate reductase